MERIVSELLGVVVIGRNEGLRLERCLNSILQHTAQLVYVDSGSTDGSQQMASAKGVEVLALDIALPFTAARARNTGLKALSQKYPNLEYVQFVDGDCELAEAWLAQAVKFLDDNQQVAVVCGRRRERYPEASIYNFICDEEWNTPVGEAKACGGDALMRIKPLLQLNGYREDLIAGEEPELCVRLRALGWKIWRIDAEMTLHDAAMTKFKQWWKRTNRAGYAFAEGVNLHGDYPERHWVVESKRALIWGGVIPILIILFVLISPLVALLLSLVYPLQIGRVWKNKRNRPHALPIAVYLVLGKFAEFQGQLKFLQSLICNKRSALIEYK